MFLEFRPEEINAANDSCEADDQYACHFYHGCRNVNEGIDYLGRPLTLTFVSIWYSSA